MPEGQVRPQGVGCMRTVRAVNMSPDGIEIAYMDDSSDLRGEAGSVYQVHTIVVSRDDAELEEAMDDLETAVSAFLEASVVRWATTLPATPEAAFQREMDRFLPKDEDDEEDR